MTIRTILAATVAVYALTTGFVTAQAKHPVTGEALAENQT